MKRTFLAFAVAALAAAVGAGAALVSTHGNDTTPATQQRQVPAHQPAPLQVVTFTQKDSSSRYVDSKPSGLSAGDVLTQHSVWSLHGHAVGVLSMTSTVTLRRTAETGEVQFTGVASLEGGDLVMTGRFDIVPQNQTFKAAITGGTGQYENARGYVLFKQVSGNVTLVTVHPTS